ncbi:MAG: hypothetical protein Kow0068_08450 [Marinilabiliales bacterium]
MLMKQVLIIISLFYCISLFSQQNDDEEFKTLLSDSVNITGYGYPVLTVSNYNNQVAAYIGGGGGLIINNKFFIGGFGNGLISNFQVPEGEFKDKKFEIGCGGIWIGYIFFGTKMIHPELSLMASWGGISISEESARYNPDSYDSFMTISPTVEVNYTPVKFLRIGAGFSYNYVNGLSFGGITDKDFTGPGGYIAIKLGWF